MCLATVYKEEDNSVIFKNVSRIDVDGNKLILRDIMGDERVVEGSILMVDLANSIVKAANEGEFNFLEEVKEYAEKAKIMKRIFIENGFSLTYETDLGRPLADGFYFTLSYPGMTGNQLVASLLYYGISAIALDNTGSEEEGIRACVSFVKRDQFDDLEKRLRLFNAKYSVKN